MTPPQTLRGITSFAAYPDGRLKECKVNQRHEIETSCGVLIMILLPLFRKFR
ncbi:hypothetical protein SDC9_152772 [bioreactor metagenome]|uniref:Uncharacterized protein n=1 Tax=bioreactor metagenome TaxID=1076179 RepID=A0A645EU14_9ZZZZ